MTHNLDSSNLAPGLGVTEEALKLLGVGWNKVRQATSWPMRWRVDGPVHGIRYRRMDGRKFSERGGRDGVFVPFGLRPGMELLVITEGATDTAAGLSLNLPTIGRPSVLTGNRQIIEIANTLRPKVILITADYEPHGVGRRESERLAQLLADATLSIVFVWKATAGHKDLRGFVRAGGTATMLTNGIEVRA